MTVRDETAKTPCETGARSYEGGETYLKQYVDRLSGEPAQLAAWNRRPACHSGVSAVAVEALVNHAGEEVG